MRLSSLLLIVPTFLSVINASSFKSSSSKSRLNETELKELMEKKDEELSVWLAEKRLEYDAISEESSLVSRECASASTGSSPSPSPKSSSSPISASTPVPPSVSKFDQMMLLNLQESLRLNERALATKLIKCIPNLKMTYHKSNFSVLSLIATYSKTTRIEKLKREEALFYFKPLITGKGRKFAGGYFLALALFDPVIQIEVMKRLLVNAPNLRDVLLIVSIYYKLDETVIDLILKSGAKINFTESDDVSPLKKLPSYKNSVDEQVQITKRLFMNYSGDEPLFASWEHHVSHDAEVNFLYGMVEARLPEEIGALRKAFENYSPEIVMRIVDLSPLPTLTNYHLAHLLALNPEKRFGYPAIESLVDPQLVFDRLMAGETDLVALAYIADMTPDHQVQAITEFLGKTTIFEPHKLDNVQTMLRFTPQEFIEQYGISELPISPAHTFFLTACKCNIADEAFALIWNICKRISSRQFFIARRKALDWAIANRLTGKIAILNQK